MLGWLWAAIIGLVAGALAKLIMPGKDPGGIFVTMLIGIAGALLMTFIGRQLGFYRIFNRHISCVHLSYEIFSLPYRQVFTFNFSKNIKLFIHHIHIDQSSCMPH